MSLKKEIEFEEELRGLMGEYGKSLRDIIAILEPDSSRIVTGRGSRQDQSKRRERTIKVYKNPQTGEIVKTKGGNHKVLKAWKTEHGAGVVESWLQG
ncbi:hypothetical protein D3C81_1681290 [compost metagenome]